MFYSRKLPWRSNGNRTSIKRIHTKLRAGKRTFLAYLKLFATFVLINATLGDFKKVTRFKIVETEDVEINEEINI